MPNAELELRATAREPEEQEADDMRPETLGEAPVGTMLVRTTSFMVPDAGRKSHAKAQ